MNGHLIKILFVVFLLAVALHLRLGAIDRTVVNVPIRADARDYYSYAINLKFFSTYSRKLSDQSPPSDALRSPGYPLFLYPFVSWPPTKEMLWRVSFWQVALDTGTVLLTFLIARALMPFAWAWSVGLLTALSPHLISMTTYLLTETLFTFLMLLALWLTLRGWQKKSSLLSWLAGNALGAAALTRPTLQYFPIFLVGLLVHHRTSRKKCLLPLMLGFCVVLAPWITRNMIVLGKPSDPTLMVNTIHHGMYPNLTYRDIPQSRGIPYRFDPRSAEISKDLESVLREVVRRLHEEPLRHLKWYLFGKPITLFSWSIIGGAGDIFIYPVERSPYRDHPFYRLPYEVMRSLHWPLVVLAWLAAAAVAWLPRHKLGISGEKLSVLRLLALIMLYFLMVHMIGAPYPRYSIPLRPVIYTLAIWFLYFGVELWSKSGSPSLFPAITRQKP